MDNLATEMLKDQKTNNKRTFIALIVTLLLWFTSIMVFVWYLNQYEYVDTTQTTTVDDTDNTNINQNIGE